MLDIVTCHFLGRARILSAKLVSTIHPHHISKAKGATPLLITKPKIRNIFEKRPTTVLFYVFTKNVFLLKSQFRSQNYCFIFTFYILKYIYSVTILCTCDMSIFHLPRAIRALILMCDELFCFTN